MFFDLSHGIIYKRPTHDHQIQARFTTKSSSNVRRFKDMVPSSKMKRFWLELFRSTRHVKTRSVWITVVAAVTYNKAQRLSDLRGNIWHTRRHPCVPPVKPCSWRMINLCHGRQSIFRMSAGIVDERNFRTILSDLGYVSVRSAGSKTLHVALARELYMCCN